LRLFRNTEVTIYLEKYLGQSAPPRLVSTGRSDAATVRHKLSRAWKRCPPDPQQLWSTPPAAPPRKLDVATTLKESGVVQIGPYLVGWSQHASGKREDRDFIVTDGRTGKQAWSKQFTQGLPERFDGDAQYGTVVFRWAVRDKAARAIIDADPRLRAQLEGLKDKKAEPVLFEVLKLTDGTRIGSVVVDGGGTSFWLTSFEACGDHVILTDNKNRILVYSLSSGNQTGHAFGSPVEVAKDGSMLLVQNLPGQLTLYSLPNMQKKDELTFTSRVVFARFSGDNKRTFLLTKSHKAFVVDLEASQSIAAVK
jgi:hypothetical protein